MYDMAYKLVISIPVKGKVCNN